MTLMTLLTSKLSYQKYATSSSVDFIKKGFLFRKIHRKTLAPDSLLEKKITTQVDFAKFLRIASFKRTPR